MMPTLLENSIVDHWPEHFIMCMQINFIGTSLRLFLGFACFELENSSNSTNQMTNVFKTLIISQPTVGDTEKLSLALSHACLFLVEFN